jgi:hypothetical protein
MTPEVSRRGKEYLETAQTLLRAAQTMADRAIAGQLKALAEDYQRRAENVDAAKAFARSAANAEVGDRHNLTDSFAARPAEEISEVE